MVAGEIMDDTTDKKELDEIHKRAIKRFDWREIPGLSAARDWWILDMEAIK